MRGGGGEWTRGWNCSTLAPGSAGRTGVATYATRRRRAHHGAPVAVERRQPASPRTAHAARLRGAEASRGTHVPRRIRGPHTPTHCIGQRSVRGAGAHGRLV